MNRLALVSVAALVTLVVVFVGAVFVIDASGDDRIADGIRIGKATSAASAPARRARACAASSLRPRSSR